MATGSIGGYISRQEYGWEVETYRNKQLLLGQMFQLRAAAERFAAERRQEFERDGGWRLSPPGGKVEVVKTGLRHRDGQAH
jgi:hypothetical protein